MVEIGARLDEGAGALRHLLAVDGQEAVDEDTRRHAEARPVQHRGPEQGVEVGDVLADEVIELDIGVRAPRTVEVEVVASRTQVSEAPHVPDWRVQPDVEVLSGDVGDLEAEVRRIPRDVPVLQAGVEPLVELVGNLGLHRRASVAAAVGEPPPQRGLEVRQTHEVVLRRAELGPLPGQHRHRVVEVCRAVGGAADLAVVSVLVGGAAARARALDVAVRQEHRLGGVVRLVHVLAHDVSGVVQPRVDQLRAHPILGRMGGVIVVERNPEVPEVGPMLLADHLDESFRGHPFLLGLEHDGGAVSVVGAHVRAAAAESALEPHPDVGLDVFHHVPEVNRAVGVGQSARHHESASRFGHGIDSVAWPGDGRPRTLAPSCGGRHDARSGGGGGISGAHGSNRRSSHPISLTYSCFPRK